MKNIFFFGLTTLAASERPVFWGKDDGNGLFELTEEESFKKPGAGLRRLMTKSQAPQWTRISIFWFSIPTIRTIWFPIRPGTTSIQRSRTQHDGSTSSYAKTAAGPPIRIPKPAAKWVNRDAPEFRPGTTSIQRSRTQHDGSTSSYAKTPFGPPIRIPKLAAKWVNRDAPEFRPGASIHRCSTQHDGSTSSYAKTPAGPPIRIPKLAAKWVNRDAPEFRPGASIHRCSTQHDGSTSSYAKTPAGPPNPDPTGGWYVGESQRFGI